MARDKARGFRPCRTASGHRGDRCQRPGACRRDRRHGAIGRKNPDIRFLVFGDRGQIEPLVSRRKQLAERCEVRHAEGVVTMDAKPSHAMRNGKGTSMWNRSISVRNGERRSASPAATPGH